MIWRHELKYLIDDAAFLRLYHALSPVLQRDLHEFDHQPGALGGYRIRSLYFDDHARTGIFDKLAGTDPRHKYRVRIYNGEDNVIRLEKKIKSGSLTQKHSCSLTRLQVDSLLDGDADPVYMALLQASGRSEQTLLGQFYTEWQTRQLRPRLLVDYWRLPFVWPDGNVRVTFDRFLATGFYRQDLWDPDAAMQSVLPPQMVILEVKYDHFLPAFICGLLELSGAIPIAVSKYVQCAAWCRTQSWEDQT
jgi:hypothetical protein